MEIHWISLQAAEQQLAPQLYVHLADDGSLTRRVRETCPDSFEVRLIDHHTVRPEQTERELLDLQADEMALARQVFLCCDNMPRVYARTIIGLVDRNRPLTARIERLGQQSLGSILFRDPLAQKRMMHLAELPLGHAFFQGVKVPGRAPSDMAWIRRSLYDYEGCELIVYEAFVDFDPVATKAPVTVVE